MTRQVSPDICGGRRPFHGTLSPSTRPPPGTRIFPASRSCTWSRSRSLVTSLLVLGAVLPVGVPPGDRGPIVEPAAAWRRCASVPARSPKEPGPAGGRHPAPRILSPQHSDLLDLGERQVAARWKVRTDRRHPTSLTKPARPQRHRHATRDGGILTGQPSAIFRQRRRRSSRRLTGGRPGDRSGERTALIAARALPCATTPPPRTVLRRPVCIRHERDPASSEAMIRWAAISGPVQSRRASTVDKTSSGDVARGRIVCQVSDSIAGQLSACPP